MPTGNCSIEEFEARLQSRIAESAADAPRNSGEIPQRSEIALSNIKAEDLAIELGLWIPYSEVLKLGMPFPSGIENEVYFDETSHTVVKINNLITSQSISRLFRRLLMHNAIFPQTKYELVGFTGFGNGSVYPILRQDYVTNATYATHGEILDYMEALGFTLCGDAEFSNGKIRIKDLRPRNVLKNTQGSIFVVDADFEVLTNND